MPKSIAFRLSAEDSRRLWLLLGAPPLAATRRSGWPLALTLAAVATALAAAAWWHAF